MPLPTKILVANRGEIALRVIRACREMGIPSVAVYSDADRGSLHVRAATQAVCIGPPSPAESYLRPEALLEAAAQTGADAIHPGYGFLSENAGFAQAVKDAGLIWIGPSPDAIRWMGEKVAARRRMIDAEVPVVPGLADEADDPARLVQEAESIGYPVMIKASGGGGGKGIRVVERPQDLVSAWERARSEAQTGFGNAAVYLEKFLARSRHVEIQVFADRHGNAVHLGERECSMQRRHQKLVEEAPSPIVDEDLRARMGEAAVRAARSVDYEGAGTVEFLVDEQRHFYFLEMNTRLQVEHPVTEMVTGFDLVREQIRVAGGEPLSFAQEDVNLQGHAIEVRLCSEEPERGFLPATGEVSGLELPGGSHVRFDSALYAGQEIGVHYDPMLAKLIVSARDREGAIRRMGRALRELKVTGVATNCSFLLSLVESDFFRSGDYHTKTVEDHLDTLLQRPGAAERETAALLAALVHRQIERERAAQRASQGETGGGGGWVRAGRDRAMSRWES